MKTPLSMFVLGLLSLCPIPAAAQQPAEATSYPARSVKVVVPYPPGAAADIIGRLVAQKLSELTGSQFYVENLPGAGGIIGTAAAPPSKVMNSRSDCRRAGSGLQQVQPRRGR